MLALGVIGVPLPMFQSPDEDSIIPEFRYAQTEFEAYVYSFSPLTRIRSSRSVRRSRSAARRFSSVSVP